VKKIDLKREKSRVPLPIVPTVNKDLANKLLHNEGELDVKKKSKQNKETPSLLNDARFQSLFTNPDMQIDANHESFKNIAPLVSRLNKQNVVEDESISMENAEEEEEENEEGEDNDNLIDDILTSDEEDEEEKIKTYKTKLVPTDTIDDTEQETLRSLSFNERAKKNY